MKIRNYRNDDADFLKEMLLTAIYNPDETTDPKVLLEPELKYIIRILAPEFMITDK